MTPSSSNRSRAFTVLAAGLCATLALLQTSVVSAAGTAVEDTLEGPVPLQPTTKTVLTSNGDTDGDVDVVEEVSELQKDNLVRAAFVDAEETSQKASWLEAHGQEEKAESEGMAASTDAVHDADVTVYPNLDVIIGDMNAVIVSGDSEVKDVTDGTTSTVAAEKVDVPGEADAMLGAVLEEMEAWWGVEQSPSDNSAQVVTVVTTTTTTTTTTEEDSVITTTKTTHDEEHQTMIEEDDVVYMISFNSEEDEFNDPADATLGIVTAGNSASISSDVSENSYPQAQGEIDATYASFLDTMEAPLLELNNDLPRSASSQLPGRIVWDGDGWPIVEADRDFDSSMSPDVSTSLDAVTIPYSLIRSLTPILSWGSNAPNLDKLPRRFLRPGSITLGVLTDNEWPTPLHTTQWVVSVDLIGVAICALALTLAIVAICGLYEGANLRYNVSHEEGEDDEEHGDAAADDPKLPLLTADKSVATAKSADTEQAGCVDGTPVCKKWRSCAA